MYAGRSHQPEAKPKGVPHFADQILMLDRGRGAASSRSPTSNSSPRRAVSPAHHFRPMHSTATRGSDVLFRFQRGSNLTNAGRGGIMKMLLARRGLESIGRDEIPSWPFLFYAGHFAGSLRRWRRSAFLCKLGAYAGGASAIVSKANRKEGQACRFGLHSLSRDKL
jgi:hypothetical protein